MSPRKIVTPPDHEPLTLDEAKLHLRVDHDLEDAKILGNIRTAREAAEEATSRTIVLTTYKVVVDGWPAPEWKRGHWRREIRIDDELQEVVSVSYRDPAGVLQVLDETAYDVDEGPPGRIVQPCGVCWPCLRPGPGAVEIVYTAGYASDDLIPQSLKDWMLLLIGNLYENRESTISGTIINQLPNLDDLLGPASWGGYL